MLPMLMTNSFQEKEIRMIIMMMVDYFSWPTNLMLPHFIEYDSFECEYCEKSGIIVLHINFPNVWIF